MTKISLARMCVEPQKHSEDITISEKTHHCFSHNLLTSKNYLQLVCISQFWGIYFPQISLELKQKCLLLEW